MKYSVEDLLSHLSFEQARLFIFVYYNYPNGFVLKDVIKLCKKDRCEATVKKQIKGLFCAGFLCRKLEVEDRQNKKVSQYRYFIKEVWP
jgi:hypothetical protein